MKGLIMKVTILDARTDTNSKTGEVKNVLLVLASVLKFGTIKKQGIEVVVTGSLDNYDIGEDMDLDIVLPYSEYPYKLN